MTQYRTAKQVKKFDTFKIITFGILVVLLLLAWSFFRAVEAPPAITEAPTAELTTAATPAATEPASDVAPSVEAQIAAPALDLPGGALTPGSVTLSGTGEPGSEVEVVIDGQPVGKTTVGNDGKWSFTADLPEPGDYQVSVQNVNADGEVLAASEAVTVKVAEAATEEVATAEAVAVAPALDLPGGDLTPGTVTLNGTGEAGSEVEIVVDGQVAGKTTVDSAGKWSFAADLPEPGDYQVSVQNVDADGNVLAASGVVTVKVAEVATEEVATAAAPAPATPALDAPSGKLSAGMVNLTGTGEPGSEVQIVVDGQPVGQTTVDSEGKWSFPVELPDPGDHNISVQSLDTGGAVVTSSQGVAVQVGEAAAGSTVPTIDLPGDGLAAGEVTLTGKGEPGSEVQVVVDGQPVGKVTVDSEGQWSLPFDLPASGDYEISVQSVDASGEVVAASEASAVKVTEAETAIITPTLDLPSDALTAGEVILTGTGEPETEVEVVVDGQPVGTATVDGEGQWTLPIELSGAGDYQVNVQSVDASGQVVAASEEIALTVTEAEATAEASTATSEEGGQAYIVQADDWLSKLADKFYGDIFAYPTIVEATNAKAQEDSSFATITNPDLIEIGQKLWIPEAGP